MTDTAVSLPMMAPVEALVDEDFLSRTSQLAYHVVVVVVDTDLKSLAAA